MAGMQKDDAVEVGRAYLGDFVVLGRGERAWVDCWGVKAHGLGMVEVLLVEPMGEMIGRDGNLERRCVETCVEADEGQIDRMAETWYLTAFELA
jgi:hypothetical protein